ncbi:MAG TPA: EamA family transporter [Pseudomonas xinjiangensis]|uniref:EamA family transporter n=2 Tax=root TaxID=1 RepID=A0A7V1BNH1_9GAMM|nr:EamA family transporter [Halopseudomonas xinjiangensis]HEC46801.1 EamA family transporter [Halopseudomonas xinjiangensis]
MSGKTINSAIMLLVIGNALALVSDVFIKILDQGAPIFQFAFMRCVITLALLVPLWRQLDSRRFFEGGRLHFIRAHIHLIGILCMVVALASLPLATANAVFYAAPILVMILSVLFFGERMTALSLTAVISGFAGILVILRPVDVSWAALAALGSAASLALNAVLVRKLPAKQSTAHKLFLNYLMITPICLAF